MTLAQRAALLLCGLQWNRWERQTRDPAAAQKRLLREIVQRNQNTAFGKNHGFTSIKSVADFRKQVPIGDYEVCGPISSAPSKVKKRADKRADINVHHDQRQHRRAEADPVTESTRTNHSRLTKLWYSRAFRDHPGSAAGKVFGLVGRAVEGHTAGGIPYGAASGLIYQSSPAWIKRTHALPYEIA
jgi:hypothetical protein